MYESKNNNKIKKTNFISSKKQYPVKNKVLHQVTYYPNNLINENIFKMQGIIGNQKIGQLLKNQNQSNTIQKEKNNITKQYMEPIIQPKFSHNGLWMNKVDDIVLRQKFANATAAFWQYARDSKKEVFIKLEGSGASYWHKTQELQISKNLMELIKNYVLNNVNKKGLGPAISMLTHELSHVYDHFERKQNPFKGKTVNITTLLETELRAWMWEAKCAYQNDIDKNIKMGDEDKNLVNGWIEIYNVNDKGKDFMDIKTDNNKVIGRLHKYFKDNYKSENNGKDKLTLKKIINDDKKNKLKKNILYYAKKIYELKNKNIKK